jgi:hypothetical protein
MKTTSRQRLWVAAAAATVGLASWRLTLVAGPQPQSSTAVRTVPNGRPAGGNPGEKGATYYALENQTNRFTTVYTDGTKAVAERGLDGDIVTSLNGKDGSDINRVRIDRVDGVNDVVQYIRPSAAAQQVLLDGHARPTLDWLNRQSRRFHQDHAESIAGFQWRDGLMRRAGPQDKDDDRDVRSVETQWANGLSAQTTRVAAVRGQKFDGHPVQGDVLVTRLMRDGLQLGIANYFTYERIYAWNLPGVTEGLVANEHLKARHGGWPFTPDMVWLNLQTIALYHWKSAIDQRGFVARCELPSPGRTLLQRFAPTLSADEGCDGLHWLDGSVLRYCCDVHDACYEKYGCSASSWWRWWSSWQCGYCNSGAVFCFASGGTGHGPYSPYPW